MKDYVIGKSFDFSIRLIELVKYLQNEGKEFPLSERLLLCGTGISANLRVSGMVSGKEKNTKITQALAYAVECEDLLKVMAKTDYLTERQSTPIRDECRAIIDFIEVKAIPKTK